MPTTGDPDPNLSRHGGLYRLLSGDYYFANDAAHRAFIERFEVKAHARADFRAAADEITPMGASFNVDWLARQDWRVGVWISDAGPGLPHARILSRAARATGDDWFHIDGLIGPDSASFRVPAEDALAIQLGFLLQILSYRALPPSRAFAVSYAMDEIATYAAPAALMPTLSFFDTAEAERDHAYRQLESTYHPKPDPLLKYLFEDHDGFWWWQ